jgi:fructose-1,6-bisphosphatase
LTDKIFVKQSIVSSDDVNYKDIQCPECHDNQFIILSGYLMIPREEIFEKGKLTKQQESTDISFDVKQANIFALEKTNLFLNEEVRKLTGKDPLSLGPIN